MSKKKSEDSAQETAPKTETKNIKEVDLSAVPADKVEVVAGTDQVKIIKPAVSKAAPKKLKPPKEPSVELVGIAFTVDRSAGERSEGMAESTIFMVVSTEQDVGRLERIRTEKKFAVVGTHNFEKLDPIAREALESAVEMIKNPPELRFRQFAEDQEEPIAGELMPNSREPRQTTTVSGQTVVGAKN